MRKVTCITLAVMLALLPLLAFTVSAADLTLKATDMTLSGGGAITGDNPAASTGKVTQLPGDNTTDSYTVTSKLDTLADGKYDISVYYFDESDGVGTWSVKVAGKEVSTWQGDQNTTGTGNADAQAYGFGPKVISGVDIKKGDEFSVTFTQGGDAERGRLDKIDFAKAGTAAATTTAAGAAGATTTKAPTAPAQSTTKAGATGAAKTGDMTSILLVAALVVSSLVVVKAVRAK